MIWLHGSLHKSKLPSCRVNSTNYDILLICLNQSINALRWDEKSSTSSFEFIYTFADYRRDWSTSMLRRIIAMTRIEFEPIASFFHDCYRNRTLKFIESVTGHCVWNVFPKVFSFMEHSYNANIFLYVFVCFFKRLRNVNVIKSYDLCFCFCTMFAFCRIFQLIINL